MRYLPKWAVSYPAACSAVAIVVASRKMWKPPYFPWFEYTPVVCEYWPVRMLARLGQQSGLTTKAFLKSTPWSTRSDWTFGISAIVS